MLRRWVWIYMLFERRLGRAKSFDFAFALDTSRSLRLWEASMASYITAQPKCLEQHIYIHNQLVIRGVLP
jgi:hypothetical protein